MSYKKAYYISRHIGLTVLTLKHNIKITFRLQRYEDILNTPNYFAVFNFFFCILYSSTCLSTCVTFLEYCTFSRPPLL